LWNCNRSWNKGISELWEAIDQHSEFRRGQAPLNHRREKRIADDLLTIIKSKVNRRVQTALADSEPYRRAIDDIAEGKTNPYAAAVTLLKDIAGSLSG
jgi:putative protein kinase ArgK-like GTPase of G3E family